MQKNHHLYQINSQNPQKTNFNWEEMSPEVAPNTSSPEVWCPLGILGPGSFSWEVGWHRACRAGEICIRKGTTAVNLTSPSLILLLYPLWFLIKFSWKYQLILVVVRGLDRDLSYFRFYPQLGRRYRWEPEAKNDSNCEEKENTNSRGSLKPRW